jgi:hypothetical protein
MTNATPVIVVGGNPLNPMPVTAGALEVIAVAASATNEPLQFGGAGGAGDLLNSLTIVPSNTSPGAVSYKDGSGGASITIFVGGANSVNTLHSWTVTVGGRAATGPWYVTTGAGVTVTASGEARSV